jgi:hypothetical protein
MLFERPTQDKVSQEKCRRDLFEFHDGEIICLDQFDRRFSLIVVSVSRETEFICQISLRTGIATGTAIVLIANVIHIPPQNPPKPFKLLFITLRGHPPPFQSEPVQAKKKSLDSPF